MTKEMLKRLFEQVEVWPAAAQEDLVAVVGEIEKELKAGPYRATADELAGIDRGLRDAAEGRFATAQQVEAVFAKYRRA